MTENDERYPIPELKKFFEEISKNLLTSEGECDIIVERSYEARNWTLTIEQQKIEVQSKIKASAKYRSVKN